MLVKSCLAVLLLLTCLVWTCMCVCPYLPCRPCPVNLTTILPAATVNYSSLTISGLSSGGFMAMQYHFAHSADIRGAGIFAAAPYGTFYNSTVPVPPGAIRFLVGPLPLLPVPLVTTPNSALEAQANAFASAGLIDPTSNLNGSRVFVFNGLLDSLVNNVYGHRVAGMYADYGANVASNLDMVAAHTVPTNNFPTIFNDCPIMDPATDFVNNCAYEGIFAMFAQVLGSSYVAPASSHVPATGTYSAFYQAPYTATGNLVADFMDYEGLLYVPLYCQNENNTCSLHIALHGCFMSIYSDLICNLFAMKTGYFQVADANNMVIVFPQASPSLFGPDGLSTVSCWDFAGGVSADFCLKSGPQITSIYNISRAVAGL